jgi:hypothetical protein
MGVLAYLVSPSRYIPCIGLEKSKCSFIPFRRCDNIPVYRVGSGTFGVVKVVRDRRTNTTCAAKCIPYGAQIDVACQYATRMEHYVLSNIRHVGSILMLCCALIVSC